MNTSYILEDWVPINELNWSDLSKNPNAIDMLEENQTSIDWINLAENPNAFHILEKNAHKLPMLNYPYSDNVSDIFDGFHCIQYYFDSLVSNPNPEIFNYFIKPNLLKCIENNDENDEENEIIIRNLNLTKLYSNPNIMNIINDFSIVCPIDWEGLTQNPHPMAIEVLRKNPEFIVWDDLMKNPSAIALIKEINDIEPDWEEISFNMSYEAIEFILESFENDYNKIINNCIMKGVASNPYGLELTEKIIQNNLLTDIHKKYVYIGLAKNPMAKHILSNPETFTIVKHQFSNREKRDFYKNLSINPCIFNEISIGLK